jgi:peptidoglycan/xylan/chitin deacetylase (PgdA/CDA1 family)
MKPGSVVLMYHGVGSPARFGEERYTVSEQSFTEQLAILARTGRVTSLVSLLDGSARPGAIVLTFDDGEQSVVTRALPRMQEHGLAGTLFVTTGWIGTEGYLGAEELTLLEEQGWTVGSHGATHRFLSDLDDHQLEQELVQSRETLSRLLGAHRQWDISLPGGRRSARVVVAARRAGYRSLCTSLLGTNPIPPPDPYRIQRVTVQRHLDPATFRRLIDGERRLYLRLQARQQALDLAKRALGNERYQRLRSALLEIGARFR